jgi:hypothetical protein
MTKDQIKIAVAKECGWLHIKEDFNQSGLTKGLKSDGDYVSTFYRELPNYPESLDACAEFEKLLTSKEMRQYACLLADSALKKGHTMFSTPLQRCEVFLRLKGKWIS